MRIQDHVPGLHRSRVHQAVPRRCRDRLYIERDKLLCMLDGILLGRKVQGDGMMRCLDNEVGIDVAEWSVATGEDEVRVKHQTPRTVDIGAEGNRVADVSPKPRRDFALTVRKGGVGDVWAPKVAQGDVQSFDRRSAKMKGLDNDRHCVEMSDSWSRTSGEG